jgi:hypothetical protein
MDFVLKFTGNVSGNLGSGLASHRVLPRYILSLLLCFILLSAALKKQIEYISSCDSSWNFFGLNMVYLYQNIYRGVLYEKG